MKNNSKRFLSFLLVSFVLVAMFQLAAFAVDTDNTASGIEPIADTTSSADLVIDDLAELKAFRDDVNNGNTYSGKTVVLNADIDLGGVEWTPIGNSSNKFQGTFDGNGKTISNLVITGTKSDVGLFGFTTNGEIKNLTVENAKVSGRLDVGVVAGSPYTSKYTNITVTGHVEVNGFSYVGGVGGKNAYANWTDITVDVDDTSYVKAVSTEYDPESKYADENGYVAYRTYVGGVIGFIGEGGHTFKNIRSDIKVSGDVCDIGGIAGIAHYGNNFVNVTCSADVTNTSADADDAAETGGIAGVWHNQDGTSVKFEGLTYTGTVAAPNAPSVTFENGGLIGSAYISNGTGTITGSVAVTGGKTYGSLDDAIAAAVAANGGVVSVITDVNYAGDLVIPNGVTLDTNGNTVDVAGVVTNMGAIAINGGELKAKSVINKAQLVIPVDKEFIQGIERTIGVNFMYSDADYLAREYTLPENATVLNVAIDDVPNGLYRCIIWDETFTKFYENNINIVNGTIAVNGGTLTVSDRIDVNMGTLDITGTSVLNLDGATLNGHLLVPNADLTVNGGTINNVDNSVSGIEINAGALTLNDVTVLSARHALRIDGLVAVAINGGTYKVVPVSGMTVHAINVSGGADVTINDGTFVGPKGTSGDSGAAVKVQANSKVTILGGNFSGGKVNTLAVAGELIVKGGTFDQDPSAYVSLPKAVAKVGNYYNVVDAVAKIGTKGYATVADALAAAEDGDTITLISGDKVISMAGSVVGNKTVTITGSAIVDWTLGNLFIGRGGEGNGKVIFDGANITSYAKKTVASTGFHVSGSKASDKNTNDGVLVIKNSNIEVDYLINRNEVIIEGNSTVTVYGGCYTHGRDASESSDGTAKTATLTIESGATVIVVNENGMGVGGESNGIMTVKGTYKANVLHVSSIGLVTVDGGTLEIDGTLENAGANTTFKNATVKANKLLNSAELFIEGENTIQIDDVSGSTFAVRVRDGAVFNDSYMPGGANETVRLLGSATFNGGFKCAYLQGASASKGGIGGTVTIEDGTTIEVSYGVEFGHNYTLNGGTIKLSGGNASGDVWGCVFQDATFTINTDIDVDGNGSYAPIHFTNATATINSSITQKNSRGEPLYIGDTSDVTIGSDAVIDALSIHGEGKLTLDATNLTEAEYANIKCPASGFTGTIKVINNKYLYAEIQNNKIVLVKYDAMIGDVGYKTLAEAFAAAQAGDVIELQKNVTVTDQIKVSDQSVLNNITFNGNGHTITAALNQDNQSVLYFGNTATGAWATGVKVQNVTINGTARFGIALMGGTSSELTNVTITGDYVYGINLYGTHGATMTNCDIVTVFTNGSDDYPLTLVKSEIGHLYANKSDITEARAKVFIDADSIVSELTFWGDTSSMIDAASADRIVMSTRLWLSLTAYSTWIWPMPSPLSAPATS